VAHNDYIPSRKDNEDSDDEYLDRDELDQALRALSDSGDSESPSPSPSSSSARHHGAEAPRRQEMTLFEEFNDLNYDPRANLRNRNRVSSPQPSSDNRQRNTHAGSQPNQVGFFVHSFFE
jgi:hypothetical protein